MIKRFIYLGYYFKKLDREQFDKFFSHVLTTTNMSARTLWKDLISSSIKYNIGLMDYFYFKFHLLSDAERNSYAGSGYMYEYQLKMNPKSHRDVLENKILFIDKFKDFLLRKAASITILESNSSLYSEIFNNPSGRVVAKGSLGQVGAEVKILKTKEFTTSSLLRFMKDNNLDLLEEYVIQHPDIMRLSPSGLNTIRVFTQLDNGKLHYLGARLRMTINSEVDNMAAGNPAAPIDIETGKVIGDAVFSDITREPISIHPITGVSIIGFQVPFWSEIKQMMDRAVLISPENKSIGWDIAITENGPELIEGNHNWCKLLWQLPAQKGLRRELEQFTS